ncbi:MAG TPA: DUF2232 domain-containing protein [Stellaceae bacterium]|nr:DUF2232 domain-containing protein [Stellaceae bacterium]
MGARNAAVVAALCGAAAAVLYLAVALGSTGAAILVSLAQLPLFLAGLWLGLGGAAIASLSATLVLFAAADLSDAILFAALNAVPVLVLTRQALLARRDAEGGLEWYPPGPLTAWLAGLALLGLGVAILAFGGPHGLESVIRRALDQALAQFIDAPAAERSATTRLIAAVVPGITAASWMVMTITNAVLAQGILARFGANWRPSPDIAALALPVWLPLAAAAAAAAALFGPEARFVGVNVLIALGVPFCLGGLALFHAVARRYARPAVLLTIFYVMAGLFGWPLLVAAVMGLIDASLGLRRRFTPLRR